MSDIDQILDDASIVSIVPLSKQRRLIIRLQPGENIRLASGVRGRNGTVISLELLREGAWVHRFDISSPIHALGELIDALVECERGAVDRGWLEPDEPDGEQNCIV